MHAERTLLNGYSEKLPSHDNLIIDFISGTFCPNKVILNFLGNYHKICIFYWNLDGLCADFFGIWQILSSIDKIKVQWVIGRFFDTELRVLFPLNFPLTRSAFDAVGRGCELTWRACNTCVPGMVTFYFDSGNAGPYVNEPKSPGGPFWAFWGFWSFVEGGG